MNYFFCQRRRRKSNWRFKWKEDERNIINMQMSTKAEAIPFLVILSDFDWVAGERINISCWEHYWCYKCKFSSFCINSRLLCAFFGSEKALLSLVYINHNKTTFFDILNKIFFNYVATFWGIFNFPFFTERSLNEPPSLKHFRFKKN